MLYYLASLQFFEFASIQRNMETPKFINFILPGFIMQGEIIYMTIYYNKYI